MVVLWGKRQFLRFLSIHYWNLDNGCNIHAPVAESYSSIVLTGPSTAIPPTISVLRPPRVTREAAGAQQRATFKGDVNVKELV